MRPALPWLAAALLLGGATPSPAATADRVAEARAYVHHLAAFGFSGQVLVTERGRTLVDEEVGIADAGRGSRVTAHTRFPIASVTKTLTALATLILEHDGRLALSDTLGRFFPAVPTDKRAITVEELLTHTSGLRRDVLREVDSLDRADAVQRILESPLRHPPPQEFSYSNAGYELLAAIVEQAAGEPYDAFVERRVFGPAGMRESGFIDAGPRAAKHLARGTRDGVPNGRPVDPAPGWKGTGAGSAYATATDLARWHRALRAGRLVPADDFQRMTAPRVRADDGMSYGYGWFLVWPGTDSVLVFHGGDTDGLHSELRWYTREDQLMVVLTNQDVFDTDGGAVAKRLIARDLHRILLGRSGVVVPRVTPMPAHAIAALRGTYATADSDRFELLPAVGGFRIAAIGSRAAAALLPPADTLAARQRSLDARARALLESLARGDTTATAGADPADFGFAARFLGSQIADDVVKHGALQRVEMLGSVPIPWDPAAWRTYALLHFERGDDELFLGRQGSDLNDVTTGAGVRSAMSLPVARLATGDLVAFDILRQRVIPIALERRADGAIAAVKVGALRAERRER